MSVIGPSAFAFLVAAALATAVASPESRAPSPKSPTRIISTSPGITEVLFALGLGGRVVAVSDYCQYPPAARALPKVGSVLRPNVETMARLRPDLAILHLGPNDAARQLAVLGIPALVLDHAQTLDGVYSMIRAVGRAAAVPAASEQLVTAIQARLGAVRAASATQPRRKVLVIVGRAPGSLTDLVAASRDSFLGELIAIAGGVNVLDLPRLPSYPRISMETVIRLAPDMIVDAGDMGQTPAEHARRRPMTEALWKKQTAVVAAQRGRVHAVTSNAFVVPGPRVVEAAETLAAWLRDDHR